MVEEEGMESIWCDAAEIIRRGEGAHFHIHPHIAINGQCLGDDLPNLMRDADMITYLTVVRAFLETHNHGDCAGGAIFGFMSEEQKRLPLVISGKTILEIVSEAQGEFDTFVAFAENVNSIVSSLLLVGNKYRLVFGIGHPPIEHDYVGAIEWEPVDNLVDFKDKPYIPVIVYVGPFEGDGRLSVVG